MEKSEPNHPPKRPRVKNDVFMEPRGLEQFVIVNSKIFFQILQLSTSFLSKDLCQWNDNKDYREALQVVRTLAVVNNHAEKVLPSLRISTNS